MLSKAGIACWCLSGSAQISRFYAFSKDPSSSSGRLFLSLSFVSFSCHWMPLCTSNTQTFVSSEITHSRLFCSVFSRAYLQGDLDLQSHCTEGFKEEKWDVIIVMGAAVAGTQFSLMTSNPFHTALLVANFWPVGPLSVCQHKDDTMWALDFVLLKGKHPRQFST